MTELTHRLAKELGCRPAIIDRLCAALALAEGRPLPTATPLPAEAIRAIDDFPDGPALVPLLRHTGAADAQAALAAAVLAGRRRLTELLDANAGDLDVTLADVIALASSASAERRFGGFIELPVGVGDSGPISWSFNRESGSQTNANTRIVGQPGTGKTQFLMHLLASLGVRARPGFLLLDYKGDLAKEPGFARAVNATVIRPLEQPVPVNPFDLPKGLDRRFAPMMIAEAIAAVGKNFGDKQRKLLRDGIEVAYGVGLTEQPSAKAIAQAVKLNFEAEGRGADTVVSLLEQVADFDLFADTSAMSVDQFLARRWIIDLSDLQALRDLVAFVLLSWFARQVESLDDTSAPDGARHVRSVLAIDEAHHYFKRRCAPLQTLLRVGRSKGVPVVVSTQSLNDFKGMTELEEFFLTSFVMCQGGRPDGGVLKSALRVSAAERAAVADACTRLDQFEALTTVTGGAARPVRLHGFFQGRWRQ